MVPRLCVMITNCVSRLSSCDRVAEAAHVGFVQRRVGFVQNAERRRLHFQDREHQRRRGQRSFAARQQRQPLLLLARRARHDLHARRRDVLRIGQHQLGRSAREQFLEHALELFGDLLERLAERRLHQLIEFDDDLIQLLDRLFQVRRLLRQKFKALLGLFVLALRFGIDRPQAADLRLHALQFLLHAFGQRLRRSAVRTRSVSAAAAAAR